MPRPTNRLLRQLLTQLGFQQRDITAKNLRVFRHPGSNCILLLPENKSLEAARPADVVGIKGQLDYRGHLDEKAFDRFCEEGRLPTESK